MPVDNFGEKPNNNSGKVNRDLAKFTPKIMTRRCFFFVFKELY